MDNAGPKYPGDFVNDYDVVQFSAQLTAEALTKEIVAARSSLGAAPPFSRLC